jgi:hypothetical protein
MTQERELRQFLGAKASLYILDLAVDLKEGLWQGFASRRTAG